MVNMTMNNCSINIQLEVYVSYLYGEIFIKRPSNLNLIGKFLINPK